jgi:hypothetical protein
MPCTSPSGRLSDYRAGSKMPLTPTMPGWRALLGAGLVMLGLLVPGSADAQIIDRILAVVDRQPITLSDVNAAVIFQLVPPAAGADPVGTTLDRLIERSLVLAEVERYQPPEPAPESIAARVEQYESHVGTGTALQHAFDLTGFSAEQLRRWARDDLRSDTYLNQRFGTTDPAARQQAVSDWIAGLRRRSNISVRYAATSKGGG